MCLRWITPHDIRNTDNIKLVSSAIAISGWLLNDILAKGPSSEACLVQKSVILLALNFLQL